METAIIDLMEDEVKEISESEKGWGILDKLYQGAIKGIPGAKSIETLAQEYLSNCGGKKNRQQKS